MTEGVLLLTTDGDAAHALTHPSREMERTYVATVRGNAPAPSWRRRSGVELEDGPREPESCRGPLRSAIGAWEFDDHDQPKDGSAKSAACARRSASSVDDWCARDSARSNSASLPTARRARSQP